MFHALYSFLAKQCQGITMLRKILVSSACTSYWNNGEFSSFAFFLALFLTKIPVRKDVDERFQTKFTTIVSQA